MLLKILNLLIHTSGNYKFLYNFFLKRNIIAKKFMAGIIDILNRPSADKIATTVSIKTYDPKAIIIFFSSIFLVVKILKQLIIARHMVKKIKNLFKTINKGTK